MDMRFLPLCAALLMVAAPAAAQNVDFGDDSSMWANDGECDDPRFEGPGMTSTTLLDSDIRADATDCRTAFEAGELWLKGDGPATAPTTGLVTHEGIDFGDDSSGWANDGECDDPRFRGPGMSATRAHFGNIGADATDCLAAFQAGDVAMRHEVAGPTTYDGIDFGDDSGDWSNDGECDDPRFRGPGMTETRLLDADIRADASDCLGAYLNGTIWLVGAR